MSRPKWMHQVTSCVQKYTVWKKNERTIVWSYAILQFWTHDSVDKCNFERTIVWTYAILNTRQSGHKQFWIQDSLDICNFERAIVWSWTLEKIFVRSWSDYPAFKFTYVQTFVRAKLQMSRWKKNIVGNEGPLKMETRGFHSSKNPYNYSLSSNVRYMNILMSIGKQHFLLGSKIYQAVCLLILRIKWTSKKLRLFKLIQHVWNQHKHISYDTSRTQTKRNEAREERDSARDERENARQARDERENARQEREKARDEKDERKTKNGRENKGRGDGEHRKILTPEMRPINSFDFFKKKPSNT